MSFIYTRTVHLADTDAAGVVYFAQVLAICHEAYEAYLAQAGVKLQIFVIPIIRSSADFLHPLRWGDRLFVRLSLQEQRDRSFELAYEICLKSDPQTRCVQARTCHVCIDPKSRAKIAIPSAIALALSALKSDLPQPSRDRQRS